MFHLRLMQIIHCFVFHFDYAYLIRLSDVTKPTIWPLPLQSICKYSNAHNFHIFNRFRRNGYQNAWFIKIFHIKHSYPQGCRPLQLIMETQHIEVRKAAKIRNHYNQVPHLTQDTAWESDKNKIKHHKQNPRGQSFPSRCPQDSNKQTRKHDKHKT